MFDSTINSPFSSSIHHIHHQFAISTIEFINNQIKTKFYQNNGNIQRSKAERWSRKAEICASQFGWHAARKIREANEESGECLELSKFIVYYAHCFVGELMVKTKADFYDQISLNK